VRKDLDGAKKVARMAAELSPGRKVEILLVTVTPIVITSTTPPPMMFGEQNPS
jgi:hypothetical protein